MRYHCTPHCFSDLLETFSHASNCEVHISAGERWGMLVINVNDVMQWTVIESDSIGYKETSFCRYRDYKFVCSPNDTCERKGRLC